MSTQLVMIASLMGHLDIVSYLIQHKANVDSRECG